MKILYISIILVLWIVCGLRATYLYLLDEICEYSDIELGSVAFATVLFLLGVISYVVTCMACYQYTLVHKFLKKFSFREHLLKTANNYFKEEQKKFKENDL